MKGLQFNVSSRAASSTRSAGGVMIESLESRRLLSADLAPLFVAKLPAAFPTEGKPQVTVRLVNTGDLPAKGSAHIELFASTDGSLGTEDVLLAAANKHVAIKPLAGVGIKLKVPKASNLPAGSYTLIARVSGAATLSDVNADNNIAIAPSPVVVQNKVMDLSAQFAQIPGDPAPKVRNSQELALQVTNVGNVTAKGTVAVTWYLSADTTLDANDLAIAALPAREIHLVPGQGQVLQMRAVLPVGTPLGVYYVLGKITPGGGIIDSNPANDVAVTPTPVAIIKQPTGPRRNFDGLEFINETYYVAGGGVVVADPPVDDGTPAVPIDDGSGSDPGVDTTPPQTNPATDPTTEPATQPTTDPTTAPSTQPSTEPDVPPISDPAPSTQPTTEPDPAPAPDPTPTPAPDPPATTDTDYSSSGGDF